MNWQTSVKRFMELAKQNVRSKPEIPPTEELLRCAKLIWEEVAVETIDAMGFQVMHKLGPPNGEFGEVSETTFIANQEPLLTEIADGIADGIYVLLGLACACGIDMTPIMEEVCRNNLDKFLPGHSWDATGKLIKPEGHTGPDIKGLLERQSMTLFEQIQLINGYHRFIYEAPPIAMLWDYYKNARTPYSYERIKEHFGSWFTNEHGMAMIEWVNANTTTLRDEYERYRGHPLALDEPPF